MVESPIPALPASNSLMLEFELMTSRNVRVTTEDAGGLAWVARKVLRQAALSQTLISTEARLGGPVSHLPGSGRRRPGP